MSRTLRTPCSSLRRARRVGTGQVLSVDGGRAYGDAQVSAEKRWCSLRRARDAVRCDLRFFASDRRTRMPFLRDRHHSRHVCLLPPAITHPERPSTSCACCRTTISRLSSTRYGATEPLSIGESPSHAEWFGQEEALKILMSQAESSWARRVVTRNPLCRNGRCGGRFPGMVGPETVDIKIDAGLAHDGFPSSSGRIGRCCEGGPRLVRKQLQNIRNIAKTESSNVIAARDAPNAQTTASRANLTGGQAIDSNGAAAAGFGVGRAIRQGWRSRCRRSSTRTWRRCLRASARAIKRLPC